MYRYIRPYGIILVFLCLMPIDSSAQNDSSLVKQAAKNYILSFYLSDPSLLIESVHPNLVKSTLKEYGSAGVYLKTSSREEMVLLAKIFNKDGRYNEENKADIFILDLYENYASVKLVAEGWVDYLHLVKLNGKWQIINILWFLTTENKKS